MGVLAAGKARSLAHPVVASSWFALLASAIAGFDAHRGWVYYLAVSHALPAS
ncbi:MAG TPA: hypothetical protein VNE59_13760 [Burkholderiales bacterium]|nr:hypothetical protein [Burkholderiales bacterium]